VRGGQKRIGQDRALIKRDVNLGMREGVDLIVKKVRDHKIKRHGVNIKSWAMHL
tara:strand:+ start:552 stop:713 length:162 start_codon:yes stop_codon:yes gene_type:complete